MASAHRTSAAGHAKDDMEQQLTAKLLQEEGRKEKQEEGRRDKQNFNPGMLAAGASMGLTGTMMLIIYYALCSSTMLVINKVALEFVPAPSFVMLCQMGFAAAMSRAGGALGFVEVDPLEKSKVVKFILVVLAHIGCIFCNMNVLQNSNVETFITFRSSTPLILSICDYIFLGRVLPSVRSWLCLVVLLAGSVGYVLTDTGFKIDAYYWLIAWYLFFIFDVVYVKHVCENVKMTNWGRVFYTNVLTCPIILVMLPLNGEVAKLATVAWTPKAIAPLVMSCVMGLGMSHAGYMLRDACTATLFTVVGIICKVVSVIINWMIWDKHATIEGIGFLMMCVMAGTFYQQAPKRQIRL